MRKPLRNIDDLIEDGILQPIHKIGEDLRCRAYHEVLCSLPIVDYQTIKKRFKNNKILTWIPRKAVLGCVYAVGRDFDCVLYLNPSLETRKYQFVLSVIAHELSHLIWHHFPLNRSESLKELQANLSASEWGY